MKRRGRRGERVNKVEILIQSFMERAQQLGSSFHIRYRDNKGVPSVKSATGKEGELSPQTEKAEKKRSYVVIHKSYTYLEPVVRSMFEGAEDVQIVVDRRWHERRQAVVSGVENRRVPASDRRRSTPILDILINVEA
jgi:hypothetical protein